MFIYIYNFYKQYYGAKIKNKSAEMVALLMKLRHIFDNYLFEVKMNIRDKHKIRLANRKKFRIISLNFKQLRFIYTANNC